MNLFDNIIQSSVNNFTGEKVQPQFTVSTPPQAPRTASYAQPIVSKKPASNSLFPQASAGMQIVTDYEVKQMIDN